MASITVSSVLALHAEIITLHETLATTRAKRDRLALRKASLTAEVAKMKREKEEVEVALLLFAQTPAAEALVHVNITQTLSASERRRKRVNPDDHEVDVLPAVKKLKATEETSTRLTRSQSKKRKIALAGML
ncbi:hypothetical protein B0H11DRAFT_2274127 [Mycena galericulata]|nr:hypothetical protein B0H11DRAFT_2274127 [Mycena galericulata]